MLHNSGKHFRNVSRECRGQPLGGPSSVGGPQVLFDLVIQNGSVINGNRIYGRYDDLFVLDDPVNYDLALLRSLGATAQEMGLDSRGFAYDLQLTNGGRKRGAPIFEVGQRTGDLPGQLLRGAQPLRPL